MMIRTRRLTTCSQPAAAALIFAALVACSHAPPGDPAGNARDMLERGDTSAAVHYLERVDKGHRPTPDLYIMLGTLYRERNDIEGRLRSQYVLQRALQLFPDNPDVLVALGETYYAQEFLPDAERCFLAALRVDPDRCDAKYFLGRYYHDRWRRVNAHMDELMDARAYLMSVTECDTTNLDAARRYLYSLYLLDRIPEADRSCELFLSRFPDCGEFYMMRATIAYDDGLYDQAWEDYMKGLELVDEESRAAYTEIRTIFSYRQTDVLDMSAVDEQKIMTRGYWVNQDPDPTTEVNERYLEHMHRVFLADINFSVSRPETRGWDTERGETYIKFGPPIDIYTTLAGGSSDGRTEMWSYVIDGRYHTFVFVDEYLNGNLRIPYSQDLKLSFLRHSTRMATFPVKEIPIPGDIDVVTFRDSDFSSSVYIAVRVDADSMHSALDLDYVDHFQMRGTFFDDEWIAEKRFAETIATADLPLVNRGGRGGWDLVRRIEMPFDYYHFACTFDDEYGLTAAQFRADSDTYRYADAGLMMSDVLLLSPALSGQQLQRRGNALYPNPGHVYRHGERLGAYFEIYGLAVSSQTSEYQITYAIYEAPEEPSPTWLRWARRAAEIVGFADDEATISQTIQRAGVSHDAEEDMRINVDSLREGRYQLVVSVYDRGSGQSVESTTVFEKVGGPQSARR